MRKKIKFKQYHVQFKGHKYDILIPPVTDQLWIINYGNKHWGTKWDGNRQSLESVMYVVAVLGFNPADKIIYFPIRKNERADYYRINNREPWRRDSMVDEYDLIFTTHQVPFKRSEWTEMRKMFRYLKPETYTLCYDSERTVRYFEAYMKRWEHSKDSQKEYEIETVVDDTLFYVFSRRIFQAVYLSLEEFLRKDLETEFMEGEFPPFDGIGTGYTHCFPYRERLQQFHYMDVEFMDIQMDRIKREWTEDKKEKWVSTYSGITGFEKEKMTDEMLCRITASYIDEQGCLSQVIIYKDRKDYRSGETRKYDRHDNLIFCKVRYCYPEKGIKEETESTEYTYDGNTLVRTEIFRERKKILYNFWHEEKGAELLSETRIFRQYFYNENGVLERTEDEIYEPGGNSHREYTTYEIIRKERNTQQTIQKTYRRNRSKPESDKLLYQRMDCDFYRYSSLAKRERTEYHYRRGSVKKSDKTETTIVYDYRREGRVLKEIQRDSALFHDYREIDKNHSSCMTYRLRKAVRMPDIGKAIQNS